MVTHVVSSSGGEAGAGGVCALAIAGAEHARTTATTRPLRRTRESPRLPRSSPRALLHVTQRDRLAKARHRIALRNELVREDALVARRRDRLPPPPAGLLLGCVEARF